MIIEKVLNKLQESYSLEQMEIGEYAKIKKFPFNFDVKSYKVGDIGSVSTLNMSMMFGLMKMETVVFTPRVSDVPLFSFDFIKAMGKETILIDIYDLTVNKGKQYPKLVEIRDEYKDIPNYDLKPCWYDTLRVDGVFSKTGKKLTARFDDAADKYLTEFMNILQNGETADEDARRAVIQEYVDGLFDKGSPTTEQFNKILGEERAREMYSKYIFFSKK